MEDQKCPRSWPWIMALDHGPNHRFQIMTMVQIMIFWIMVPWVPTCGNYWDVHTDVFWWDAQVGLIFFGKIAVMSFPLLSSKRCPHPHFFFSASLFRKLMLRSSQQNWDVWLPTTFSSLRKIAVVLPPTFFRSKIACFFAEMLNSSQLF